MTDRLSKIRARAEAATCGCYTVCEQDGIDCPMSYDWQELWREDIPYLLAENEWLQCEIELVKNAAIPAETKAWKQAAMEHYDSAQRWAKEWAESDDRERAARAEVKRLRVVLELGYRATEARNLLAAASDDWGTTPMLSEFHERADEILWPEGPPS